LSAQKKEPKKRAPGGLRPFLRRPANQPPQRPIGGFSSGLPLRKKDALETPQGALQQTNRNRAGPAGVTGWSPKRSLLVES
jgi:hypothetical protein